ncbi:MAG: DUF169 domain-containing protein [Acidobacteriota bacterium]|nr:DUF169 domain-containing protein [Blastocatellia bacterium]MDW8239186.1 DUF169 domain-containing protein [Acidobacteriota bacterium]
MRATYLQKHLNLTWSPVAVTFVSTVPKDIPHVEQAAAAGCSYWKLAAEGVTFYTTAADHLNCPIGAFTHHVDWPPERANEREELLTMMVGLEYVHQDEIAALPRRREPCQYVVYAPLTSTPLDPDVIIVRGNAKQIMLLAEAARAANVGHDMQAMLRPTCAIIPEAIEAKRASLSLGCIGNRVYTDLGDDHFYFALPGPAAEAVLEKLPVIVAANDQLEQFHRIRKTTHRHS